MGNYSRQREEIIRIIRQMSKVPSAEEIYFKAKKEDPAISKSTVYRNLIYFVKHGILIPIPCLNGPDRYFYKNDNKNYGFVICEKCGKIQEFVCDFDMTSFQENLFKQIGTTILKKEMLLKCICEECKLKLE